MAMCLQIYVEVTCFYYVVATNRWRNCHVEITCYC